MMTALNGMFNGHFGSFVEGRLFWIMMGVLLSSTMPFNSFNDIRNAVFEFLSELRLAFGMKAYGK